MELAPLAVHTRSCDEEMLRRLRSLFSSKEIAELVVSTAWYHLCAVILDSLPIEQEAESR